MSWSDAFNNRINTFIRCVNTLTCFQTVSKKLNPWVGTSLCAVRNEFSDSFHRFRFCATIGGFSSKENCISAAVNQYHIWNAWGESALRPTVFSYRWLVVYLFLEGFRVQDIATILHVRCTFVKKLIKLYRETSTVNYAAERAAA